MIPTDIEHNIDRMRLEMYFSNSVIGEYKENMKNILRRLFYYGSAIPPHLHLYVTICDRTLFTAVHVDKIHCRVMDWTEQTDFIGMESLSDEVHRFLYGSFYYT